MFHERSICNHRLSGMKSDFLASGLASAALGDRGVLHELVNAAVRYLPRDTATVAPRPRRAAYSVDLGAEFMAIDIFTMSVLIRSFILRSGELLKQDWDSLLTCCTGPRCDSETLLESSSLRPSGLRAWHTGQRSFPYHVGTSLQVFPLERSRESPPPHMYRLSVGSWIRAAGDVRKRFSKGTLFTLTLLHNLFCPAYVC
jgi:hypothetical protein